MDVHANAATANDAHVLTVAHGGVLRIELRRPAKKNALTTAMYQALIDALQSADRDPGIRVVLLHGQPDVFTSGNDLKDFLEEPALADDHVAYRFVRTISTVVKPIVAAVNGACVGVGATLLLHCDLVYAGDDAVFALPFVNLGLCPEAGSSLLLPLAAGHARAAELLMLGEPFGAATAADCGIVTRVLPKDCVLAHAEDCARKLAAKPPAALRLTKTLMRRGLGPQLKEAIETESREFQQRLRSPEAKEAFAAFLEKRKPDYARFA